MKKDIEIPEVEGIFMAAVHRRNEEFTTQDWNAILINQNDFALEMVLIVSKGFDSKDITSTMRHSLKVLPAKSYSKVELLQPEILKLNNKFSVSFFAEGKMLHKNFVFRKNSIKESNLKEVPILQEKAVLAE